MKPALAYILPAGYEETHLRSKLAGLYTLQENGREVVEQVLLDTFDWQLHASELIMQRRGYRYELKRVTGGEVAVETGVRKSHPFWWDFPEGSMQDMLRTAIGVRALMRQLVTISSYSHFSLLSKNEKTVARLKLVNHKAERDERTVELRPVLLVEPLRGYNKPRKRVCELLEAEGFELCKDGFHLLPRLHDAFGIDRQATDLGCAAQLQPEATLAEAVRDHCLVLQGTMMRNLSGILEDIDTEFLHDFRVSIRRTRSLLSVLKKYLPAEDIAFFQGEFKWLGSVTGPVRDLDVYLLSRDAYRAMLPEELYPGLDWFFQALAGQRKRKLKLLREHLRSERFTKLAREWEKFLIHLPERDGCPAGQRNCREIAEKIIRKRFKRLLRDGGRITPDTPDEKLHELRIEGKKFRYTLESFRSLFDDEATAAYLRQMKKLQKNLGDFNDYSVQREVLVERLGNLQPTAGHSVEIAAALGGLIVHLGDKQQHVRRMFERTFQNFATRKNIKLLESIFIPGADLTRKGGAEDEDFCGVQQ